MSPIVTEKLLFLAKRAKVKVAEKKPGLIKDKRLEDITEKLRAFILGSEHAIPPTELKDLEYLKEINKFIMFYKGMPQHKKDRLTILMHAHAIAECITSKTEEIEHDLLLQQANIALTAIKILQESPAEKDGLINIVQNELGIQQAAVYAAKVEGNLDFGEKIAVLGNVRVISERGYASVIPTKEAATALTTIKYPHEGLQSKIFYRENVIAHTTLLEPKKLSLVQGQALCAALDKLIPKDYSAGLEFSGTYTFGPTYSHIRDKSSLILAVSFSPKTRAELVDYISQSCIRANATLSAENQITASPEALIAAWPHMVLASNPRKKFKALFPGGSSAKMLKRAVQPILDAPQPEVAPTRPSLKLK